MTDREGLEKLADWIGDEATLGCPTCIEAEKRLRALLAAGTEGPGLDVDAIVRRVYDEHPSGNNDSAEMGRYVWPARFGSLVEYIKAALVARPVEGKAEAGEREKVARELCRWYVNDPADLSFDEKDPEWRNELLEEADRIIAITRPALAARPVSAEGPGDVVPASRLLTMAKNWDEEVDQWEPNTQEAVAREMITELRTLAHPARPVEGETK